MERKGQQKRDRNSPKSFSQRSHKLFHSIINLSASGIRTSPQRLSPANSVNIDTTPENRAVALGAETGARTVRVRAKTKNKLQNVGNQSPSRSSSSSVSSGGGSGGPNLSASLLGPGPKTFSILTALNELSIREPAQDSHIISPARKKLSSVSDKISRWNANGASKHSQIVSVLKPTSQQQQQQQQPFHSSPELTGSVRRPTPTLCQTDGMSSPQKLQQTCTRVDSGRKCNERTPEWIWKLFQLAKHGRLHELKESLQGLDAGLIRHLVDSRGNTLLHCVAREGHLSTLQWLVSILGDHVNAALGDFDASRRTPILVALKRHQIACFQWLVLHTKSGAKALLPSCGERSLLHYAASYGNLDAAQWLISVLQDNGSEVDLKDAATGLTPLCEAAKRGHSSVAHMLIMAGADPLYQTDAGWRPLDFAVRHRQLECANYFMIAETAATFENYLSCFRKEFEALQKDQNSLRTHFRELLRVGKWLVKERTDLIKNFPSIGGNSVEASILLGGSNNGARFSDLEHKLAQGEQAVKQLNANYGNLVDWPLTNSTGGDLQATLWKLQERCNKVILSSDHSSGSNDCSSTHSSVTDEDDEYGVKVALPFSHKPVSRNYNPSASEFSMPIMTSSQTAPWLLNTEDSKLSTLVNPVDLLVNSSSTLSPELSGSLDATAVSACSSGKPVCLHKNSAKMEKKVTYVEANILEVVEPSLESIKRTPDLIRETKHSKADGVDSAKEWEGDVSEILACSTTASDSSRSKLRSSCTDRLPNPFAQKRNDHTTFLLSKQCQNHSSFSDSTNVSVTSHSVHASAAEPTLFDSANSSADSPNCLDTSVMNSRTSDDAHLEPTTSSASSKGAISQHSSEKIVFPVHTSIKVPEHLQRAQSHIFFESEDFSLLRSCGSETASPKDLSLLLKKDKSVPDYLSAVERSDVANGHRLSPSLSEASKTESAIAPPSNASQTSEISKTESSREVADVVTSNDREQQDQKEVANDCAAETFDGAIDNSLGVLNDDNERCGKAENSGVPHSQSLQTNRCISRSLREPAICKPSIQHSTKVKGRRRKAWYELDASDDDEKTLLTNAMCQPSRPSNLSTSSLTSSESENESGKSAEHESDAK